MMVTTTTMMMMIKTGWALETQGGATWVPDNIDDDYYDGDVSDDLIT